MAAPPGPYPSYVAGRHGDLLDELGKQRAALGVGDRLLSLDLCPLAVAGHTGNLSPGESLERSASSGSRVRIAYGRLLVRQI
jgi:hypothetical protein